MQLVHVAANFAYVYYHERYPAFEPPLGFLFSPHVAPILAHSKALFAADYRVDMWLVNVYRAFGVIRLMALALPLTGVLSVCLWRLQRSLRAAEAAAVPALEIRFSYRPRVVILALELLAIITVVAMAIDPEPNPIPRVVDDSFRAGLDALYTSRDPNAAVAQFRKVLEHNPYHYAATFQLAMALDQAGKPAEARPLWQTVLKMAEIYNDKPTVATARVRLARMP